ncbi:MAG: hypothetical protein D6707_07060, partial [Bacteroidetes bacterium]
ILVSDIELRKNKGDELYGSIVFPSLSLEVDNSDGFFNFLIQSPQSGYNGQVHLWRWNPSNQSLKNEFFGYVSEFSISYQRVSFTFHGISDTLVDKLIPTSYAPELNLGSTVNQEEFPLLKSYGRNLNIYCPLVYESPVGTASLYKYFAGWGKVRVTAVRANNFLMPDSTKDPQYGWYVEYDADRDISLIVFPSILMKNNQNEYYNVTADIESLKPARRNLLTHTEDFEHSSWAKTNVTVKSNAGYAPDSRQSASYFRGNAGASYISQSFVLSKSAPYGLFGYVLAKNVPPSDYGLIEKAGEAPAPYVWSPTAVASNLFIDFAINGTVISNSDPNLLR